MLTVKIIYTLFREGERETEREREREGRETESFIISIMVMMNMFKSWSGVQRGDAEMAQKLWRVVRACVEMGGKNPIKQIHDQGAGGNCNVVCLRLCYW